MNSVVFQIVEKLRSKISGLVVRGLLINMQDASTALVNLGGGEQRKLPVLFPFAVAMHPPAGSQVICVFLGADRGHGYVVWMSSDKGRPSLTEGQSALFDAVGKYFKLNNDGTAVLVADFTVQGKLTVTGDIQGEADIKTILGDVKAGLVGLKTHTHPVTAAPGETGPGAG